MDDSTFLVSLGAGAVAGCSVDLIIFPLDTLKTRLQSAQGFRAAGGFSKLYAGLASVALGSAPGSAAFFCTYDSCKQILAPHLVPRYEAVSHMLSASLGEAVACLIRVPVEVVKQRTQAKQASSSWNALNLTLKRDGIKGLFRGYTSTVMREIPFSLIQFPMWEFLKKLCASRQGSQASPLQTALCGALSGGLAAAITTPLDVVKTRIILDQERKAGGSVPSALLQVYRTSGLAGLYSGVLPRTLSLSIGGFIFLGAYEKSRTILEKLI